MNRTLILAALGLVSFGGGQTAHALVARSTLLAQAEALPIPTPMANPVPSLGVQTSAPQAEPTLNNPATYDRTQALKQYASVRDPFKRPNLVLLNEPEKSPLELYPVDQMKIIGVLTGPKRMRALLRLPDGQTHIVTDKMKIGIRNGVVQRVTPKGVRVVEKIVNIIGEEEIFETDIPLNDNTAAASAGNPGG